jgi:hypothetical protein
MRRSSIRIVLIAVAGLLVLSAAGCGGKKSASSTTTTTTTTTAATTSPAATTAPATTASGTTSSSVGTSTSGSGTLGALASAANCKSIANIGTELGQALQGANGDVSKEAALFQQFAAKTPSDIRPAFETLASALSKVADSLKGVDLSSGKVPNAATLAKLEKLGQQLNTPAITKADQQIAAWAAANCHS